MKIDFARKLRSILISLMLGAFMHVSFAQQVPTPGTVQEPLRKPPAVPTTPRDLVPVESERPRSSPVPAGGKEILIERFIITGNEAISTEELQAVLKPYQGQLLTLFDIYEIADELTTLYRQRGYTLASVTVPAQKVSSGVVRLEAIEGRVGEIRYEDNQRYTNKFLAWQLDEIEAGTTITDEPLEKEILLLNDLPGLTARAVIVPGEVFGTSDVVIQTQEKLFDAGLQLNNFGRTSVGEWRLEGDASLNGALGYGERFDISVVHSESSSLDYLRVGYSMPVTRQGTRASIYYSTYDYDINSTELGRTLALLDIDGEGENFGVAVQHPVWRSRYRNLFIGMALDRTLTQSRERTFGTRSRGDLTLFSVNALYNATNRNLNTFTSVSVVFSTNFNANERAPVTLSVENNAQTGKFRIDASHYRPLYKRFIGLARITAVMTIDQVVDTERFRIGGPTSVRAYPSSELSGDKGYFLSGEVQHPLLVLPQYPTILKAFIDAGSVIREDYSALGVEKKEGLVGVGFGLSTHIHQFLDVDLIIAQPIGKHDSSDRNDGIRFWAGLSAKY